MKAVIFIEGGVIQDIITDREIEIRIIDMDVDDLDETKIQVIEGQDSYVYDSNCSRVDKNRLLQIFSEIE